ncbi:hypothetical protein M1563_00865 [Patescibacteria group bacterium]|nr:hypothetical protein [Patescibacteria group bacterium]
MNTLLKTRCTKGHLVIYEDRVAIELNGLGFSNTNSLTYKQITGVEVKTTMAKIPILSKGAATIKVYATGDQKLEASFVTLDDAKRAEELIRQRI